MRVVAVDDPDDPRLVDYTSLTDVELRRVREPAEGLFLAEGDKVIRRVLAAGYTPRSALTEPRWVPHLTAALAGHDVEVYVADEAFLRGLTGYRMHRGALASMQRKPLPRWESVVRGARLVVALEDLVDHQNVGMAFRSAAALGADAVLVSPGCADPLYRRSMKTSMGTVLSLPWTVAEPWPQVLGDLRAAGFAVLGLSPDPAGVTLADVPAGLSERAVLLVGTEGDGLSEAALAACDVRVRIPMAHGVDSLNAAAAVAVAVYALASRRGDP